MTPINNSDTAWLIVSDYNQENGKFYEELRDDILNYNINDWDFEYRIGGVVGAYEPISYRRLSRVGSNNHFDMVGACNLAESGVGGMGSPMRVGFKGTSCLVGGYDTN